MRVLNSFVKAVVAVALLGGGSGYCRDSFSRESLCPAGLEACVISGGSTSNYECVNTMIDLENCTYIPFVALMSLADEVSYRRWMRLDRWGRGLYCAAWGVECGL